MDLRAVVDGAGVDVDRLRSALRSAGARFAYLHGSRVHGPVRGGSDLDVAGRVALHGVLLFEDDRPARVRWEADTRLRYFDESWRRAAVARDFLAAQTRG